MPKIINLIGKKIGKLTVLEECKERKRNYKVYKCICDCGNIHYVVSSDLIGNRITSCGCNEGNFKHGLCYSRLYSVYNNMKTRCYNKHNTNYKYYGGRGITICKEWLDDFMVFYNWAMSNGYSDNLTIDRIDVDGNYEPNNCRWITKHDQLYNTRRNVYLTYNGKTQTMKEWAEELGINIATISYRYRKGKSIKECLQKVK